ncbi:methionine ABC transporter substrate-binding protein [Lachnospiraceae bacterium KM106-2]|nr:methionine ABC transporter substrate-binding protein [Lachnospiraceae bacterium KM106-2]
MKKILSLALVLTLALSVLTGCGAGKNDEKTITVGASAVPHAEILKEAQKYMKEKGYTLKIKEFSDYVLPDTALSEGEIDANFFQHQPYLDSFNKENKTDLVSVGSVHYEPLGIYGGKKKSLSDLAKGDIVAVPNDATNEARALLLLEANGLIELKKDAGVNATIKDITKNPKELSFKELNAEQIARSLPDVAIGVINGNYALLADLSIEKDAIATESKDSLAAKTYANIVAVKKGNEDNEGVKALIEILNSDDMKKFINEKYKGSVVPIN